MEPCFSGTVACLPRSRVHHGSKKEELHLALPNLMRAYATACLQLQLQVVLALRKKQKMLVHLVPCTWQLRVMANKIKLNKVGWQKEVGVMTRNISFLWCHQKFQSFIRFPTWNGYHLILSRCRVSTCLSLGCQICIGS